MQEKRFIKGIVLFLAVAMSVSLTGCDMLGSMLQPAPKSAQITTPPKSSEEAEEEISQEADSEEVSEEGREAPGDAVQPDEENEKPVEEPVTKEERAAISEDSEFFNNEPVTVEGKYEFAIESVRYESQLAAPNHGDFYLKYDAGAGNVYIDCVFFYKNLSEEEIAGNRIVNGHVKYAEKFIYADRKCLLEEEDRSDFMFAIGETLEPGESCYVHCYFEVPEEIIRGSGRIRLFLQFGDEVYALTVKEGDDAETLGIAPNGTVSEDGVIEVGGIYATEKAEFAIEYAEFKKKVVPPKLSQNHNSYEAATGMTYLDVCIPYRNFGEEEVVASDVFQATLTCGDGTTYEGFSIAESENRTDFTYSNITDMYPLMQGYIHMLFEVPQAVAESGNVQVTLTMDGASYVLTLR